MPARYWGLSSLSRIGGVMHGNRRTPLTGTRADHFVMVKGKRVYFSFGWRFGPLITDVFGEPANRQITNENHPFWPPFEAWLKEYQTTNPPPEENPTVMAALGAVHGENNEGKR